MESAFRLVTQKRHRAAAASCGVFADPGWRKAHGRDLLEALTSLTMRLLAAPGSILSLVAVLVRSYLLLKNAESYVRSYVQLFPERQSAHSSIVFRRYASNDAALDAHPRARRARDRSHACNRVLHNESPIVSLKMMAFPFEFVP